MRASRRVEGGPLRPRFETRRFAMPRKHRLSHPRLRSASCARLEGSRAAPCGHASRRVASQCRANTGSSQVIQSSRSPVSPSGMDFRCGPSAALTVENAVGAGLDDGRVALFLRLLREHAREDIGHAAGLGRHDHPDRLVGKALAARPRERQQDRARSHGEPERRDRVRNAAHDLAPNLTHVLPPLTTACQSAVPCDAVPATLARLLRSASTQRKTRPLARPRSTTAKSSR